MKQLTFYKNRGLMVVKRKGREINPDKEPVFQVSYEGIVTLYFSG